MIYDLLLPLEGRQFLSEMGIPVECVNGFVHKELICSICTGLFQDPVHLECEHAFCKFCISNSLENNFQGTYTSCPLCQRSSSTTSPASQLLNDMMEITLKQGFICFWCREETDDLQSHEQNCTMIADHLFICSCGFEGQKSNNHSCLHVLEKKIKDVTQWIMSLHAVENENYLDYDDWVDTLQEAFVTISKLSETTNPFILNNALKFSRSNLLCGSFLKAKFSGSSPFTQAQKQRLKFRKLSESSKVVVALSKDNFQIPWPGYIFLYSDNVECTKTRNDWISGHRRKISHLTPVVESVQALSILKKWKCPSLLAEEIAANSAMIRKHLNWEDFEFVEFVVRVLEDTRFGMFLLIDNPHGKPFLNPGFLCTL
jgi:hypothetical protein